MRLAHCTAWPAAPLPRLSSALTTMIRPESTSTVACRWQELEPSGGGGVRPDALGQHVHERLVGVRGRAAPSRGVGVRRAGRAVTVARMPRGIGASTGVIDSAGRAGGLLDLRDVLVRADLVGRQVAHHLAGQQVRLGGPAGAGGAGGGDHHDVVGLDRAGGDQRRQREGDRRRRSSRCAATRSDAAIAARWPGSSGSP